jgi:N-glycosidase YbiA
MSSPPNVVRFYSVTEKPFGVFSNYAISPLVADDGKRYNSAEALYQSLKFTDPQYREVIRLAKTPHQSKVLASQRIAQKAPPWRLALNETIRHHMEDRGVSIRNDWDDVKLQVMRRCLLAKFTQHPHLAEILIGTGNASIVENSAIDSFWGCGADGKGENHLGKLLVQTRALLVVKQRQSAKKKRVRQEDDSVVS